VAHGTTSTRDSSESRPAAEQHDAMAADSADSAESHLTTAPHRTQAAVSERAAELQLTPHAALPRRSGSSDSISIRDSAESPRTTAPHGTQAEISAPTDAASLHHAAESPLMAQRHDTLIELPKVPDVADRTATTLACDSAEPRPATPHSAPPARRGSLHSGAIQDSADSAESQPATTNVPAESPAVAPQPTPASRTHEGAGAAPVGGSAESPLGRGPVAQLAAALQRKALDACQRSNAVALSTASTSCASSASTGLPAEAGAEHGPRSLLDRLLDEADAFREAASTSPRRRETMAVRLTSEVNVRVGAAPAATAPGAAMPGVAAPAATAPGAAMPGVAAPAAVASAAAAPGASAALAAAPATGASLTGNHEVSAPAMARISDAVAETSTLRPPSALRDRADAAKRAFNRADALVSLAQGYLRGDLPHRSPIEIVLTIPASRLRSGDGDPTDVGEMGESFVSPETARRLSCDAGVVEVVEDEHGAPLSVGRKCRTVTGALKRALRRRDTACTYPGCTHRVFLEGHHIKHWADGGETSLRNTALVCTLHHRYVHEYGYTIELGPDQRPRFRDPRGRLVAEVPAPPTVRDLGWPHIRAANTPLAITAETNACLWDGKRIDYHPIIGHLVAVK
jgi:hypothetical protein